MFPFQSSNNRVSTQTKGPFFIKLDQVQKNYVSSAGQYQALKEIDLEINQGEFVGIIGRSGSGKSTLMNMITGIDRPTSGKVYIGDTAVHQLNENQMARWRGINMGIIFQFFQLLPNLSVIDNVRLPMDLCDTVPARERHANAMKLLTMVEMEEHAKKLPSALSGGQQQRVAIARALANNPPILIADEPTGNLDSKTAESIFSLFKSLSLAGKTVVMVTHDSTLAQRVARTIIIADGEIVNEYVAKAFPTLSPSLMLEVSRNLTKKTYAAGETINQQSLGDDLFYIIAEGKAEISLRRPNGNDIVVDRLGLGQYFGEISLLTNQRTMATIRANPNTPLTVLTVKKTMFQKLLDDSSDFKSMIQNIANKRWRENREIIEGKEISDVIII